MPVLYSHLKEIRFKKGDIIPPRKVVGIMGSTGLAYGDHLHFGYVPQRYYNGSNPLANFYTNSSAHRNPESLFAEFGRPAKTTVTLGYGSRWGFYSTTKYGHGGIDFGSTGNKHCYNGNFYAKVLEVGYGYNGGFGNYIILDWYHEPSNSGSDKPVKPPSKPKNFTKYYYGGWKGGSIPFKSDSAYIVKETNTKKYGNAYRLTRDSKGWKKGTRFR